MQRDAFAETMGFALPQVESVLDGGRTGRQQSRLAGLQSLTAEQDAMVRQEAARRAFEQQQNEQAAATLGGQLGGLAGMGLGTLAGPGGSAAGSALGTFAGAALGRALAK